MPNCGKFTTSFFEERGVKQCALLLFDKMQSVFCNPAPCIDGVVCGAFRQP